MRNPSRVNAVVTKLLTIIYSALHTKFADSLVEPEPEYTATFGYAHNGLVLSTFPAVIWEASIRSGGLRVAIQSPSAFTASNLSVPSPPAQCPMPGTMNRRTESVAF